MSRKKTHEQYVAEVAAINPNIEVIGEYADAKTKILHRCKIDGYEWCVRPSVILQGSGCPRCAGVERYGHDEYVKRVCEVNPDIEVIGEYAGAFMPILHKCKIDGYEWYAAPSGILQGYGCHKCGKRSKGEKIISNWLDDKCTLYIQQKTFDGCKDKQALPFDFYLPDYNIVIEYQGIQHYEPVEYFGGKDKFEYTVRHDTIKENYCKENNIRLIKIPYSADTYEKLEKMYELVVKKEAIA